REVAVRVRRGGVALWLAVDWGRVGLAIARGHAGRVDRFRVLVHDRTGHPASEHAFAAAGREEPDGQPSNPLPHGATIPAMPERLLPGREAGLTSQPLGSPSRARRR